MKALIKVALRQQAIYIPATEAVIETEDTVKSSFELVNNITALGYTVSEAVLKALHKTSAAYKYILYEALCDIKEVNQNWTPLVKAWDTPTGESRMDHLVTWVVNIFQWKVGPKLPCGHIIPEGSFPLERYNGCPFCGTPFEFGKLELKDQGSKKTVLELWNEENAKKFLVDLLQSKTALDATQQESAKYLLEQFGLPEVQITMKETTILVIDSLVKNNQEEKAQQFFQTPADILRYLWYKHTGFIQMVEPKTILKKNKENNSGWNVNIDGAIKNVARSKEALKLKYSRAQSKMVAIWMNNLELPVEKICEIMHPKRSIWVRMIRALRLAEMSKKEGFEKLRGILDEFYNETYFVWQGAVDNSRKKFNETEVTELLKQRPGMFARSLFSNMLWFGYENIVNAFGEIVDKVPARLLFTLNAYAKNYFEKNGERIVKPLGGYSKIVKNNQLLVHYSEPDLVKMQESIEGLCIKAMINRFKAQLAESGGSTKSKTIFIEEALYKIPVSIGDRSENVQDLPAALMGTSFPLLGNTVRLFMQWGAGMKAQHLDMDLSAYIVLNDGSARHCSFSNLVEIGCKHSGDIRSIPDKVGTAEYIDINIEELESLDAEYVVFTCNAYSMGSLTPNMSVGWMDSKHSMSISETGVAYDPSCVQHQVRVTQTLSKGLIFGVLKLRSEEIIWLEMSFAGQLVHGVNKASVELMLNKLSSKLNVGALLKLKAEAQGLEILDTATADENYTMEWVRNTAAVTQLLVD
jgi:hypothetical protein